MTIDTDQFEPEKARKTLDSIHNFERIGLQRGIPPLWFNITISVLGGVSITLAGLKFSGLYLVALAVCMLLLILHRIRKADAIVKPLYSTRAFIAIMISTAVILIPLVLFAQANLDTFGRWVAISSGVGLAMFGSIVSIVERHKYFSRADVEEC